MATSLSPSRSSARLGWFFAGTLALIVTIALIVSGFASSSPDGLEKVAADKAFDADATDHAFTDGPLADYGVTGVDNERLSTGLAGVIGVAATLIVATAVFVVIRKRRPDDAATSPPPVGATG